MIVWHCESAIVRDQDSAIASYHDSMIIGRRNGMIVPQYECMIRRQYESGLVSSNGVSVILYINNSSSALLAKPLEGRLKAA